MYQLEAYDCNKINVKTQHFGVKNSTNFSSKNDVRKQNISIKRISVKTKKGLSVRGV